MKANSYSPSINILRDVNRNLVYYPTPNAVRVVNQIADDFKKGNRSFNIVGAYGTGKSSLLWALERSLRSVAEKGSERYFNINLVTHAKAEVIN
ncbi:hypothetical protein P1X15_24695 [Runella sp. MFBS21]|uniref:hypothetical protein n=1 Tax=Runella sp. MFBS21 TaxID=3034018 RepID=UPI0023F9B561|nr:hypothetical protein [Runella sp. MFBS21]MDF7820844.1 hypothetical protein [Runella sp. MFBS21]